MEKYICDKCGYILEADTEIIHAGHDKCPICQGKLISAEDMKEREEIAEAIDKDTSDDDFTPAEDAKDEAVDLIIIEGMKKNMKELGNDKLFRSIEALAKAEQRARYRKYWLLVGGQVPQGEPITI
jgi:uncharacterized Zn finger protein (UPF0148 family)